MVFLCGSLRLPHVRKTPSAGGGQYGDKVPAATSFLAGNGYLSVARPSRCTPREHPPGALCGLLIADRS